MADLFIVVCIFGLLVLLGGAIAIARHVNGRTIAIAGGIVLLVLMLLAVVIGPVATYREVGSNPDVTESYQSVGPRFTESVGMVTQVGGDSVAWSAEVEKLYQADVYSSVETLGRSFAARMADRIETLAPTGRVELYFDQSPSNTEFRSELLREMMKSLENQPRFRVLTTNNPDAIRKAWTVADDTTSSNSNASNASSTVNAEGSGDTPTPAPATDGEVADGDEVELLDTQPATDSRKQDATAGGNRSANGTPTFLVVANVNRQLVVSPAKWDNTQSENSADVEVILQGEFGRSTLDAAYTEKPWVLAESQFLRSRQHDVIVARSDLATSPNETSNQVRLAAVDSVISQLESLGPVSGWNRLPELQRRQMVATPANFDRLVKDRFLQRITGPGGESLWRQAVLLDSSAKSLSQFAVSLRGQWAAQTAQEVRVRNTIWNNRLSTTAQVGIMFIGIIAIYSIVNGFTKGYFVGRLRVLAVVAALAFLLLMLLVA